LEIILAYIINGNDSYDVMKSSFYRELKCAFDKSPKSHTKILIMNFIAKVGREDIFKQSI
jgi:hypothetical protein